jgi:bifunctional lysine-specific demethylase and histidyl-hydroxylase NO66
LATLRHGHNRLVHEFDALARCVADVETFRDDIWGRRAEVWRQRGPFSDLLTVDAVEQLLGTAMRRPAFRLVRDGTTLPSSDVTRPVRLGGSVVEDAADLARVIDLAADGATIVLQGLHHLWPPLQRFTGQLEEATSHRVQANAYLSPPGAAGLRHHADTHEVLVLQVEGEKAWRVDGLGELTLRAGDVLYLPAGTGHSAASQHQHSLHITIGLLARSYRQVLRGLVDDQEELRRPLPLGFAQAGRTEELSAELARVLKESAERLAAVEPEPVAAREVQRARRRPRPRPQGTLRAVLDAHAVSDETRLRRASEAPLRLIRDGDTVALERTGRRLRGPAALRPALDVVMEQTKLRVGDLAGLDEASRAVLARRLLREGFVEVDVD